VTPDKFISECEKWLSESDMKALSDVSLYGHKIETPTIDVLEAWRDFDVDLREQLAKNRLGEKEKADAKGSEAIKEILEEPNPLLMEQRIERTRWNFLEDKRGFHFFDLGSLVLYFLKLKIQERLSTFHKDEGEKFFYNICEVKHEEAERENSRDQR